MSTEGGPTNGGGARPTDRGRIGSAWIAGPGRRVMSRVRYGSYWSSPKLRSTSPLEQVNEEMGRRSDVVGTFPNDAALIRLAGALLIQQSDEWLVGRRYLSDASMKLAFSVGAVLGPGVALRARARDVTTLGTAFS